MGRKKNLICFLFQRQIHGNLSLIPWRSSSITRFSGPRRNVKLQKIIGSVRSKDLKSLLLRSIFLGFSQNDKYLVAYEEHCSPTEAEIAQKYTYTIYFWEFSPEKLHCPHAVEIFDTHSPVYQSLQLEFYQNSPSHCLIYAVENQTKCSCAYRVPSGELLVHVSVVKLPDRRHLEMNGAFCLGSSFISAHDSVDLSSRQKIPALLLLLQKDVGFVANLGTSISVLTNTSKEKVIISDTSHHSQLFVELPLNSSDNSQTASMPVINSFVSVFLNKFQTPKNCREVSCSHALGSDSHVISILQRNCDLEPEIYDSVKSFCTQMGSEFRALRDYEIEIVDVEEEDGTLRCIAFVLYETVAGTESSDPYVALLSIFWSYFSGHCHCRIEKGPLAVSGDIGNLKHLIPLKELYIAQDHVRENSILLSNAPVLKGRSLKKILSSSGAIVLHL